MKERVMKYVHGVLLLCLSTGVAGTAAAQEEHCPSPGSIRELPNGLYLVDDPGSPRWVGIAQGGVGGVVTGFASAIVHPYADDETIGFLRGCSYHLQRGEILLKHDDRNDLVALKNLPAWERTEGPFGVVYYECTGPAQACRFSR